MYIFQVHVQQQWEYKIHSATLKLGVFSNTQILKHSGDEGFRFQIREVKQQLTINETYLYLSETNKRLMPFLNSITEAVVIHQARKFIVILGLASPQTFFYSANAKYINQKLLHFSFGQPRQDTEPLLITLQKYYSLFRAFSTKNV